VTVDVLLPYYGDVAMMKQAVESILGQTSPDWTLTVIDDGYPDESIPGYFGTLADQDSRITYLRNEQNLGANGNYRKALTFVRNELVDLVDSSRRPWVWKRDASGALVGDLPLKRFEEAQQIRDVFFRGGAPAPEVNFRLTPMELDAAVRKFVLEVDGQVVEYQHGPQRTTAMTWPGKRPGPVTLTFEEFSGGRPTTVREGAWAWFRLLETARLEPESDVSYVLSFENGVHKALVRLEALSIRNPFGKSLLRDFRCS